MAGRISVGFAAALALVLVLTMVGLGWLYAVTRDVGAFSSSADMSQAAADADIAFRDLEVSVRDHLAFGDDQSLLDATWRHDTVLERLEGLARSATAPADQQAAAKGHASLNEYWTAVERVIALRNDRSTRTITVLEPVVAQTREKLGLLKSAGGVDSTALASDAAIAVLLMQEHLTRFVDRRDPQDAEAMRAQLDTARGKLTEMNRYLWVPGTRQAIGEVGDLLAKAGDAVEKIEAAVLEEDAIRAETMAPNAAGIAANIGDIRRRADAEAGGLRGTLSAGMAGYTKVALWTGGGVLLVGLLAVWLVQRSVGRPVHAMAGAVAALAAGRTDVALPAIRGEDEIAGMARAVHTLRASVEDTERQRREAEAMHGRLLREKERAEGANVAKTNFLVNLSQELHGPLNDIINSSQTLMSDLHRLGVDELATDVEHIQWTGEQLAGLVDALLDYAKIEAGSMDVCLQDFDVNRLLIELRERSLPAADLHGDTLELAAPAGLGAMHSDFTKVRQALLNLLDNACKFTEGGSVTLTAAKIERDGASWFRFTVSDTGRGFPTAQTGRLFQPFAQGGAPNAKGKPRGAGLGLTLVGHYTAMLGGDIEVASEPGQGTRITLTLPAVYQPPVEERPLKVATAGDSRPLLRVADYRPVAQLTS
ncbi:signal transduction histidine kinase [Azospirillum agricola]|uniref:sensor histidine kinase n=1 Tax=Azospirillum agricola TaxID=1720247 RepID=UPI002D80884D|nr:HAMP domain-containing sensor histidine kinase [Azospirillum agricola]MBP2227097.1 signal transduction histidine kinase [Azospirillum agricola]